MSAPAAREPLGCGYFPSPLGGLQQRVQIVGHRFGGHGVAASLLLPSVP